MILRWYMASWRSSLQGRCTYSARLQILTIYYRASLTPDSAVAHIYHFCACLPHEPYVDLRPEFTFTEQSVKDQPIIGPPTTKLIIGTVTLPNCLIHSVRSTVGAGFWRTERAAAQDAAFHAYVALHEAGLVNDNLLPLSHSLTVEDKDQEDDMAAMVEVSAHL